MATTAGETDFVLQAPSPVGAVTPEKAAGLVPLQPEQKTQLEAKAEAFVEELAASDANSPEFGRKVDQITNLGRREIAEAAGQSNRFLDRPVRAMDADIGVGTNLAELRRTIEDLDPGRSEEHTSELQSLMRISYAVFCLKKK